MNGVATLAAMQRRREFGIRLALGAEGGRIIHIVLYEGILTALVGVSSGLVVTYLTTRALESFLYGLDAWTPLFMAGGLLALFAACIGAGLPPAIRAAPTNPAESLRYE